MVRVIHIVESLERGAVENWLVRMFLHGQQKGCPLDWTFFCVEGPGRLDDLVRSHGGSVIHAEAPLRRKRAFIGGLRQQLRGGNYDVVHCHHDLVSAAYLIAAFGLPISKRIVHVHNADEVVPVRGTWKQKLLREPLRRICWAMADRNVGISQHTLDRFRLGRKRRPKTDCVHYYGVDDCAFVELEANRQAFRERLGLPADSLVFLFAGRIDPAKNPLFAFDVFAELAKMDRRIVGVFAGAGQLSEQLRTRAAASEVSNRFRYLGWTDDLPEIMVCSDLFILPHVEKPKEGLGLTVLEAQLAGLPIVVSCGVADDPILPGSTVKKLSLADSHVTWAKTAHELLYSQRRSRSEAAAALRQSPFDMDFALDDLMKLHANG